MSNSRKATYAKGHVAKGSAAEKPGCAHCRNLGLPFDHWLRASMDPNSDITCKVLLATECRYCHKLGHTSSRCSALNAKKNVSGLAVKVPSVPSLASRSFGKFSSIDLSSDNESSDDETGSVSSQVAAKPVNITPEESSNTSYRIESFRLTEALRLYALGNSWAEIQYELDEMDLLEQTL